MSKSTRKDSQSLPNTNPFDQYNQQLGPGPAATTSVADQKAKMDSQTLPASATDAGESQGDEANPFLAFNNQVKKKSGGAESSPTDGPALPPAASPVDSTSLSNGGSPTLDGLGGRKGSQGDERTRAAYEQSKDFVTTDFFQNLNKSDAIPVTQMQDPGKPSTEQPFYKKIMEDPEVMGQYGRNRVRELQTQIEHLKGEQAKYVEEGMPGSMVSTFHIKDPKNYQMVADQIAQKQQYMNQLQKSIQRIVSDQVIAQALASQPHPKSIGVPRDLGRSIVRHADPLMDKQLSTLEDDKNDIGPVPKADLEQMGLDAWRDYLHLHPEVTKEMPLATDIDKWQSDFDERNFELTAARVKHKVAATLYNNAGVQKALFSPAPSAKDLQDAANQSNLTPTEMKIFQQYVLPVEKANVGTDIPQAGFANKFGEAFQTNTQGLINLFRSDDSRLYEGLNQEVNTRFDEVGDNARMQAQLQQLAEKEKSGAALSPEEKAQKVDLQKTVEARGWWGKFWDGAGDITGQVVYQALLARGAGAIGEVADALPAGKVISKGLSKLAMGPDNVNLFFTSFINSYDNHARDAATMLPGKENALARQFHNVTMSFIEGLSENIFKDTKVLDAFKQEISPEVAQLVKKLANQQIDRVAAQEGLKKILAAGLKPFAKEFVKSEVEESTEEGVVDLADGISQSLFLNQKFDPIKTANTAMNTFLTTMAYSPFISAAAGVKHARESGLSRSGIYYMATNPELMRREVYRQLNEEGSITQQQADEKLKVINTAAGIARQIPETKQLDNAARQTYLTHRLNEELIGDQVDKLKKSPSPDDLVIKDLEAKAERSRKIREGIYKGEIHVGNNLDEITPDEEKAKDLGITPLSQADPDSVPQLQPSEEEVLAQNNGKNKGQQAQTQEGQDVLSTETASKKPGAVKAASASLTETEKEALDLLPEKQREKIKADGTNNGPLSDQEKEIIDLVKQHGKVPDFLQSAMDADPRTFIKEIQDQATATNADGSRSRIGAPKFVEEMYGKPGVEKALALLNKDKEQTDATPKNMEVEGEPAAPAAPEAKPTQEAATEVKKVKLPLTKEEERIATKKLLTVGNKFNVDGKPVTVEKHGDGVRVVNYLGNTVNAMLFPGKMLERNEILDKYSYLLHQNGLGEKETTEAVPAEAKPTQEAKPVEEVKPSTPKQEQPKETTKVQPKGESAGVVYAPLKDVHTDTERFQPRGSDYSEASRDKIVNNFDDNKLDPIVLYREKGKDYVLSGHSRLEAHRTLNELPASDPRKQKAVENGFRDGQVKARYFQGTEAQAREFADRSNDLATKNKDHESAASLRRMRENGSTKKEIQERAKEDFGKNWRYLYNLSYLNPNGKLIQTLQQFESNPDKDLQNKIEKAGQWIGAVRERLGNQITNAHENEMFDFLMDKSRSTKLERENDFLQLVGNITGRFDYNPNEPLNLSRIKNKSTAEVNFDTEEREIKQNITEKQAELDGLVDRLNNPKNAAYVNPNASDYKDILQIADKKKAALHAELTALRKSLLEHQQAKGKILSEGMNQGGLFDMNNLTPTEHDEFNKELAPDGITTKDIQHYEESISDGQQDEPANKDEHQQDSQVQKNLFGSPDEPGADEKQDTGGTTIQGSEQPAAERSPAGKSLDEKVEEKRQKKDEALQKLRDALKKSRGNLNMGIDPEVITNGVNLMAAYADLGIHRFAQIVRDVAENLGKDFLDKENVEALKGIYSYYRSSLAKEERTSRGMENEDQVDDFVEKELPKVLAEETPAPAEPATQTEPVEKPAQAPAVEQRMETPELTHRAADQLSREYYGKYVSDPDNPKSAGFLKRVGFIQGGNVFHVETATGESFPVRPEKMANLLQTPDLPPTGDPVKDAQLRSTYNSLRETAQGSEEERQLATDMARGIFNAKLDRGEENQIERQAVENVNNFLEARQYGFNQYGEDRHGWFPTHLPWLNREQLAAESKNLPVASIKLGMGLNGGWTNGYSIQLPSGTGRGVPLSASEAPLESREAAISDALSKISDFMQGQSKSDLTKQDQAAINKFNKWADALTKKSNNGLSTTSNLQSDRTRTAPANKVGQGMFSNVGTRNFTETTADGEQVVEPGGEPKSSPGLLPFDAYTEGKPGDTAVSGTERSGGSVENTSGPANPTGSRGADERGVQPESGPVYPTEGTLSQISRLSAEQKIEAQKQSAGIPVVLGDAQNIAATLPVLTPEQQGDVLAAEKRFYDHENDENKMFGKGMMFTNGTGTGKTFTGLGIADRFMKRGKTNILYLVPSDAKAEDWRGEASTYFGHDIHRIGDTKDMGKEGKPAITTYANFRDNENLQNRSWDLVINDESHKINSNGQGERTVAEDAFKRTSLSPYYARLQAEKMINYDQRRLKIAIGESAESQKTLDDQLYDQTIKNFKRTKVVFLSATPFSYHKNLSYADGYLFRINSDFRPNYDPAAYNNFYINNFGYRIRYNKLTQPESGVDVDLLERQFTENLKNQGVLVARKLKLDQDYSRHFIPVENNIGDAIDEGVSRVWEKEGDEDRFPGLSGLMQNRMNYLYTNQLLEAMKAKWSIDRIREHLGMGRKVVVFHSYNDHSPAHPFDFTDPRLYKGLDKQQAQKAYASAQKFNEVYPQYRQLDLRGLRSPIQTITEAFPGRAVQFNGTVSKKERIEAKRQFNDDKSGKDIIVVQMEAGKEGLSLHDKTGVMPRALLQLGMPVKPTDAIQSEGRIYRTGQQSNAVFEYPTTGLNFERFAFASTINKRVRTAENFAQGDEARNLETAFKEGYMNAAPVPVNEEQGTGGKMEDARLDNTTEFDKARTYYFKRQKRTTQQKRGVQGDYYATPEPLGMKMSEWMGLVPNEAALEPSAGHGAIARFFPTTTRNTFIEPNTALRSELAVNAPGNTQAGDFENLNLVNKYDGIAMNPPFGTAGKLAMDHFTKATKHLHDMGRIVSLVPQGPSMEKRMDAWKESKESKGFYETARIKLPSVTFERAGTGVSTEIRIFDKVLDDEKAQRLRPTRNIDLSDSETIADLFSRLEHLDVPARLEAGTYAQEAAAQEEGPKATTTGTNTAPAADKSQLSQVIKGFHAKNQYDTYTVKLNKQVGGEEFKGLADMAKKLGGYWSSFKGNGAIPGFVFRNEEDAGKMQSAITGEKLEGGSKMSLADKIRTWKLAYDKGSLNAMVIPVPQLWNAAVEVAARAVEGGTALLEAMGKAMDHIKANYQGKINQQNYQQEMLSELKARGLFNYNLNGAQKTQIDKVLNRVERGGNLIDEVNRIRETYDQAKARLTDPADKADLDNAYKEMEGYLFHSMSVRTIENNANNVDLDLGRQTWWQKQKENHVNVYQRIDQVQRAIEDAGLTIEEKNDMVNHADRWKSMAVAKVQEALHQIGLGDVDIFGFQGLKKVGDSFFDRMAKDNVDYNKFNLYLYARHAEERNAHNAKLRRENLNQKIDEQENEIANRKQIYAQAPVPELKAQITRLENEHKLLTTYRDEYSNPKANPDYVKMLEKQVDKKLRLMDDGGSGMTNQQAREIMAEVQAQGLTPQYQKYEQEFREGVVDKLLDLRKEYGTIKDADYEYLKNYYKNYVPLNVEDAYFADEEGAFRSSNLSGAKIFQSKGANNISFLNRVNPLTQSIIQLQGVIFEGENNNFKKTIAEAIRTAPDKNVWGLRSALYAPIKDKNGRVLNLREVNAPNTGKKFMAGQENGIPYLDGGEKKYLVIHDRPLYESIMGTNVKSAIPILSNINSFFRHVYTVYNPAFIVANPMRDIQTAGGVLSSKYGAEVSANFAKNLPKIFSIIRASYKEQGGSEDQSSYWQRRAQEYTQAGGNMAWFRPEATDKLVTDIESSYEKYKKNGMFEQGKDLAKNIADFFNRSSQSIETATRLAVYDAMLKSGYSQAKAVEAARNATINFNKKGNYSSSLDSLYLFWNANVQGTANLLWSVANTKYGKWVASGIAATGLMQSFYNNMMGDCSHDPADCYDNIPDYEKERNIIIKRPGGHGFIKIPLAYGFNVFFNAGEQIGQIMHGKQTALGALAYSAKSLFNSFSPTGSVDTPGLQQLSPTATDPVVQWATNRDGMGRKIYQDNFYDHRPDSEKGFASDTHAAKEFSQWLNRQTGGNDKIKGKIDLAPGTIDWLFDTMGGGLGQFLKQGTVTIDAATDPTQNVDIKQVPVLNRFFTLPRERSDRSSIYETLDDSYNTIMSEDKQQKFQTELQKAVRLGEIPQDKADTYQKSVNKNQFQLRNPAVMQVIDASKQRELDDSEVEAFMQDLQEKVDGGEIDEKSMKAYKAQITKNQNKLKKAEQGPDEQ